MFEYINQCQPKISVVIPVYNMAQYLSQCLDSVIGQTLKEIEIICVDDGSTDESHDILIKYRQLDNRIAILTQENAGAGAARNEAMHYGLGEFVAFMDPDDWYPDMDILETLYHEAKKCDALICGGLYVRYDESNTNQSVCGERGYDNLDAQVIYSNYQFTDGYFSYIYNLKWLKLQQIEFPTYRRGQDIPFFVKSMVIAGQYVHVDKITYSHRFSHKKVEWNGEKIADFLKTIHDVIEIASKNELNKLYVDMVVKLNMFCLNWIINKPHIFNCDFQILLEKIDSLIDKTRYCAGIKWIGGNMRYIPSSIAVFKHNVSNKWARTHTLFKCGIFTVMWVCSNKGVIYLFKTMYKNIIK